MSGEMGTGVSDGDINVQKQAEPQKVTKFLAKDHYGEGDVEVNRSGELLKKFDLTPEAKTVWGVNSGRGYDIEGVDASGRLWITEARGIAEEESDDPDKVNIEVIDPSERHYLVFNIEQWKEFSGVDDVRE